MELPREGVRQEEALCGEKQRLSKSHYYSFFGEERRKKKRMALARALSLASLFDSGGRGMRFARVIGAR